MRGDRVNNPVGRLNNLGCAGSGLSWKSENEWIMTLPPSRNASSRSIKSISSFLTLRGVCPVSNHLCHQVFLVGPMGSCNILGLHPLCRQDDGVVPKGTPPWDSLPSGCSTGGPSGVV